MSQPQTVLDVLNAMDEKFSDESKWTKGAYAKNASGGWVRECSADATCWCLVGCAIAVSPESDPNSVHADVASEVCRQTFLVLHGLIPEGSGFLHQWNDSPLCTFKDVKDLIQRAKEQVK